MTGQQLEEKWKDIELPKTAKYSYQRIDILCVPELRVGRSVKGNRCVILKMKSDLKFNFADEEKENLRTYYDKSESSLVLELIDPFYNRFFADLVISLYQLIKDIRNEDESTRIFIETVRYWADFLSAKRGNYLSEEVIQGLYGELIFLEYMIDNSDELINNILESWRGPYGANQDFHYSEKNVEVKSKRTNSNIINIASEYQLELEQGKKLELAVISIISLSEGGDTLKLIVDRIREKTILAGGLVSILKDALFEKKLNFTNIEDYNIYRFRAESIEIYDCANEDFPKITKSRIHHALQTVSYQLAITLIDPIFKVKTIDLR